jgi:acetolactate synthase I/II/III large subunit
MLRSQERWQNTGVQTMFGVLGDANLFMVDSFVRDYGGKYVASPNEAGAVLMANGYAVASARLGVATVTHGAAVTNTITAIVEGVKNRTPFVIVAGDTPVEDKENLQNVPQRDVILPTGAGFEQVRTAGTVVHDVTNGMRRALVVRRPVVVNVPVDFQWEDVEYPSLPALPAERQATAPDPTAMDRAVGIIAAS